MERSEIDAMAKIMNMVNAVDRGDVDQVIAENNLNVNNKGNVAAMKDILENMNKAMASIENSNSKSDIDNDLELDEASDITSGGLRISQMADGSYKLSLGSIVIINSCFSKAALEKLSKKILIDGFFSEQVMGLVKAIERHATERSKKESLREEYAKAKASNDVNAMALIKDNYRRTKTVVETLEAAFNKI